MSRFFCYGSCVDNEALTSLALESEENMKIILILTLFYILNIPYIFGGVLFAKKGGAGSTGGGDILSLGNFADLSSTRENPTDYYKEWFINAGVKGIVKMETLAWMGYSFTKPDGSCTGIDIEKVRKARDILFKLSLNIGKYHFEIDDNLKNPHTGEPRMAQNNSEGLFTVNPSEWGKNLEEKYLYTLERVNLD